MDIYEEEYECIDKNIKVGKERYNISILSLKSKEESNREIKRINSNLFLSKENNDCELNNDENLNSNKFLIDFTNKIYNKDEHLNKLLFKKKNSSQSNLLHLNYIPSFNFTQNYGKKSSASKIDKNRKIYRKSLFHEVKNPFEEEKVDEQKIKSSFTSKRENKKNSELEAFFKLKPKMKKPPKVLYMDSVIKNLNNSKISFNNKTENKHNSVKSHNTIKTFNKEIIFNTRKMEDEITKKEVKEEKNIPIKPKINYKVEENKNKEKDKDKDKNKNKNNIQINQKAKTEKKAKSIKKIKCIPFQFLWCLKCNID